MIFNHDSLSSYSNIKPLLSRLYDFIESIRGQLRSYYFTIIRHRIHWFISPYLISVKHIRALLISYSTRVATDIIAHIHHSLTKNGDGKCHPHNLSNRSEEHTSEL